MNSDSPKRRFFSRLVRNWVSLIGAILVVSSCFSFVLLLALDFFAPNKNPYLGILTYLVAPLFFLLGLILMGVGGLLQRRQSARAAAGAPLSPGLPSTFPGRATGDCFWASPSVVRFSSSSLRSAATKRTMSPNRFSF